MQYTPADFKLKIVELHAIGLSYGKISEMVGKGTKYITNVIHDYYLEGTISVNSRLNKMKDE